MTLEPKNILKAVLSTALKIGIALLILRGLAACKHERIVPIVEPPIIVETPDPCGLKKISYIRDIEPIITTNCIASGCHANGNAPRGTALQGYASISTFMQQDSVRFFGSIRKETGYLAMPLGFPTLDYCFIQKLETWMRQGFPNN